MPALRDRLLTIAVLAEKVRRALRRHGALKTAALCVRHADQLVTLPARQRRYGDADEFDRRHGVRTRVAFDLAELRAILRHGGINHAPSPADRVTPVFAGLAVRFEETVFIDFGSGAGRAVLLAAALPFRRVIGVEISARLHAIAHVNVERFPRDARRAGGVELVLGDAAAFCVPAEPSVVYFYNPFGVEIMARVVANLERSLADHPRPMTVIHLHTRPESLRLFDDSAAFALLRDERDIRIYRAVTRGPGRSTA